MTEPYIFPVNFVADTYWKRLGFYGKGEIKLNAGRLQIEARRLSSYFSVWGRKQILDLPLAAICDVESNELNLSFSLASADAAWSGKTQAVLLDDEVSARRLKQALPNKLRPETAQQRLKFHQFQTALLRATPNANISTAILCLCLLAYLSVWIYGGAFWEVEAKVLLAFGAGYTPYILEGQVWRLLTASLLHAGALHLLLNLYVMLQIAPLVERLYGSPRFAFLYLTSALVGSLSSALTYPDGVSVGASGAVLGLYGALVAYGVRFPRSLPPGLASACITTGVIVISITLLQGYTQAHIDNAAHWGGLLTGLSLGLVYARKIIY